MSSWSLQGKQHRQGDWDHRPPGDDTQQADQVGSIGIRTTPARAETKGGRDPAIRKTPN